MTDKSCMADSSGYGGEKVEVSDNGNLYADICQATADIEQLSLLGRQLDMPVTICNFVVLLKVA